MAGAEPGIADRDAAIARLEVLAGRLDRLGLDDFRQMALSPSAALDRDEARRTAEAVAAEAGLTSLVDDARRRVREHLEQVYTAGGYHPTWVTLNWGLSTGPVEDRVAATAAVEDAALAAIVDGVAGDAVVAELRAPFELIAVAHPPRPGGDSLPTLEESRGRGPFVALVTIVLVAIDIGGIVTGFWPLALLVLVVLVGALALARRGGSRA